MMIAMSMPNATAREASDAQWRLMRTLLPLTMVRSAMAVELIIDEKWAMVPKEKVVWWQKYESFCIFARMYHH